MIHQIITKLNHKNLSGWQLRERRKTSAQAFLAKTERECERSVDSLEYDITVYVNRPLQLGEAVSWGGPTALGFYRFKFNPCHIEIFDHVLSEATFAAGLIKNQPFELPEPGLTPSDVLINETDIDETSLHLFESRLLAALAKEKNVRLSSAEFFVDRIQTRLINHKGLDVSQEETLLHTEFILLAQGAVGEKEYINRFSRRLLDDFQIEAEVHESAEWARNATEATPPKTGFSPVLLSGEPLDDLFNPLIARASARFKYNKMVDTGVGDLVSVPGDIEGDALTLWSNGLLPGAIGTNRFDSYGTPSQRVKLIQENKLVQFVADKRYSDYLSVPATGEFSNTEIEPGTTPFRKLVDDTLAKHGVLLHLSAFSAFEPNPITGAFSAEIRSGFEITKKGVRPLKGGSISGFLPKDILNCRLSSETVRRARYVGPKGILFDRLSVAGL